MKKAQNAQAAIVNAIAARIEAADNDNQKRVLSVELSHFKTESAARALELLAALDCDAKALAKQISVSDKKNADFLAVYALQKVRKAVFALAQKSVDQLDRYTFSIVRNLASTQASSTRMMLKALNVCNVRKGSKGDSISFADNKISAQMQKMFA